VGGCWLTNLLINKSTSLIYFINPKPVILLNKNRAHVVNDVTKGNQQRNHKVILKETQQSGHQEKDKTSKMITFIHCNGIQVILHFANILNHFVMRVSFSEQHIDKVAILNKFLDCLYTIPSVKIRVIAQLHCIKERSR